MKLWRIAIAAVIITSAVASSSNLMACIYFDAKYDRHSFKETDREALIFHDGAMANVIIKTGFSGKLPSSLAWVLPVPAKPAGYKVLVWDIFPRMHAHFLRASIGMGKGTDGQGVKSRGQPRSAGIAVHEATNVGNYEIIPLEILREDSGKELNDWLSKQGFNASPDAIQQPYLRKGAFFLAIRLKPTGSMIDLKPLWIRYPAGNVSFPVRFTHDYRSFDLKVFTLTTPDQQLNPPEGLGWDIKKLDAKNFSQDTLQRSGADPDTDNFQNWIYLMDEFAKESAVQAFLARKDLQLTRLSYLGVNSSKQSKILRTKNLKSDPSVSAQAAPPKSP